MALSDDARRLLIASIADERAGDEILDAIDAAGEYNPTAAPADAVSIQGVAVLDTTPTTSQVLVFNGTAWEPTKHR